MVQNNLSILVETILSAPVWVQQAVYYDLRHNLEEKVNDSTNSDDEEIYPIFTPELSFKGKKELETHEHNLDFNMYKYFASVTQGLRVIDITLNNFWTLEESSRYLAQAVREEYIKAPVNPIISASVFYLGNEIKLGEYIKRLNKITVEQLDDVLRKQKNLVAENPKNPIKIGELLLEMGLVTHKDIDNILYVKNESKKRFILSNDMKSPAKTESVNYQDIQQKILKLTQENNLLKDKLRAIFNIQSRQAQSK